MDNLLTDKIKSYECGLGVNNKFNLDNDVLKDVLKSLNSIPNSFKKDYVHSNGNSYVIDVKSSLLSIKNILDKCLVLRCDYSFNGHDSSLYLYFGSHYVFLSIGSCYSFLKGKISSSNLKSYFSFLSDCKEATEVLDYGVLSDYLNLIINRVLKVYSDYSKVGFKLKLDKNDNLRFSRLVNVFGNDTAVLSNLNLGFTVRALEFSEESLFIRNANLGLNGDIYVIHPSFIYNFSTKDYLYIRKEDNNFIKDYLINLLNLYKKGLLKDLEKNQLAYLYNSIKRSYRLNGGIFS